VPHILPPLYAYIRRAGHDATEAQDLTQDAQRVRPAHVNAADLRFYDEPFGGGVERDLRRNAGTNNTLVLDGTLTWITQNLPGPGDTRQFDIIFPLTTPFLYDPADGNLLLDFQQYAEGSAITIDRTSDTSLTRQVVNTASSNAPTAQFYGTSQVVTQFTFEPPPLVAIRASQVEV
jgi:hypothetical protein